MNRRSLACLTRLATLGGMTLSAVAVGATGLSLGCAAAPLDGTRSHEDASLGAPDGGGFDGGAAGRPSEADYAAGGGSCIDFEDNDDNGVFDCDEPSCQRPTVNPSCCVGSTATACCDAREAWTVTTGSCGATPCLALGDATLTSALGRVVNDATVSSACAVPSEPAFAPFGRTGAHAFMALPSVVDARAAHLEVRARIGVTTPTGSDVAAAGFGLFTEQGMGTTARPLVAVVASATSNDVRVIVGDRVIETMRLEAEGCGQSREYRILLTPEGEFRVEHRAPDAPELGWTELTRGRSDVSAETHVAMFGQQPNPDGAPVAWVSSLVVDQSGCDLLAPARRPTALASDTSADVTGLSVFARGGDSGHEALITSGDQIHWLAVQAGTGGLVSSVPGSPFADNIQPTWPTYTQYQDIEVVLHEGRHRVYLAASRGDGVYEIVGTTYTPSASPGRPGTLSTSLYPVVSATEFATSGSGAVPTSVDGPAAADIPGTGLVLAVRVRYSDGHDEIRIAPAGLDGAGDFETAAPGVIARDPSGVTTDGLVHSSQPLDANAFDRDEIADPQIVVIDGIARVLYAGRRGTRWSIGSVVASPAFTHFIPVSDLAILGPDGSGFDALGVSEPTLVVRNGTLWLYYAGSDGARRGLGVAVQPVVGP